MQKAAAAAASGKRIHEVVLPKLFKWYKDDFGFSKQEILVMLVSLVHCCCGIVVGVTLRFWEEGGARFADTNLAG